MQVRGWRVRAKIIQWWHVLVVSVVADLVACITGLVVHAFGWMQFIDQADTISFVPCVIVFDQD